MTQLEFVGLSENRVLVVLVFNDREVQNRIIQLERHYSADELKRASNYLNEQFRGRGLTQARQEILVGRPVRPGLARGAHPLADRCCRAAHLRCSLSRAACTDVA